jgi:hypothetical protein
VNLQNSLEISEASSLLQHETQRPLSSLRTIKVLEHTVVKQIERLCLPFEFTSANGQGDKLILR